MHRHCLDVRLVYLLRDPVKRALSHYAHGWTMGRITLCPEHLIGRPRYPGIIDASHYALRLTK